jgi:hypothetical protein
MSGLKCPKCENKMSHWAFAKAPSPRFLKCDHCKERLSLQKHSRFICSIAVLIGAAIVFIYEFLDLPFVYLIGMSAVGAIAFEIVTYLLICRLGVGLELKERLR